MSVCLHTGGVMSELENIVEFSNESNVIMKNLSYYLYISKIKWSVMARVCFIP